MPLVPAQLAADGGGLLDNGHVVTGGRQPGRDGQPADAGADHHDPAQDTLPFGTTHSVSCPVISPIRS